MTPARTLRLRLTLIAATMLTSACAVGPVYERPAAPADAIDRGAWWSLFRDPTLDALAARIEISNYNIAAAAAAYAQARAVVREQRASLFPVVTLNTNASRSDNNRSTGRSNNGSTS